MHALTLEGALDMLAFLCYIVAEGYHKLAIDELEAFDYEEYKANNFKVNKLGDFPLKLETKPE